MAAATATAWLYLTGAHPTLTSRSEMCGSTDLPALRSKVWKQTTCRNGKCMVRKTISCAYICKARQIGWDKSTHPLPLNKMKEMECYEDLCDVKHGGKSLGAIACSLTAMMA